MCENRIQGYACGADAHIVKPFLVEEVQAVVQALLRRSGAHGWLKGYDLREKEQP